MSDALWCGRRFQTFKVLDDFNRETLAIDIDLNLPDERVIRTPEWVVAWRDYQFISLKLTTWAEENQVGVEFIKPFKPTQNLSIESINRMYRE